ncbi:MAG: MFS transporter [Candidatus Omnitrophota bacterium]|nr:MFS transporter [Candidatus Omnitrophota bacterium]
MNLSDNLKHMFRALKYKNYRLFFTGQAISLTGTWMQQMAIGWLIYRLTKSPLMLGFVGFLGNIPTFIFTPFAGVLADRVSRHRMLIVTQALEMIQALILAALIMTGKIEVWHIFALTIFLGIVVAFDSPARHAFIVEMVAKKEDVGNAIALNSLVFNSARLVGPSIAGILVALFGEGICFLINGLSYIAVIAALFGMRVTHQAIAGHDKHIMHDLKEGFRYAFNDRLIRSVLLLTGLVSMMGMSYVVLMPVFAKDVLGGDAGTLGLLMGSTGLGALVGAFFLAARKDGAKGLEKIVVFTTNIFGVGLIAFSFSRTLWLSMTVLLFVGFGMMVQMSSNNIILQTVVHDDKRGRVMSLFMVAFLGMVPFGCLIAGTLAGRFGAPNAILISGLFCVAGSFLLRDKNLTQ